MFNFLLENHFDSNLNTQPTELAHIQDKKEIKVKAKKDEKEKKQVEAKEKNKIAMKMAKKKKRAEAKALAWKKIDDKTVKNVKAVLEKPK